MVIVVIGQVFLVHKSTGLYHEIVTYVQDMDIFLGESLKIVKLKVTVIFQYWLGKRLYFQKAIGHLLRPIFDRRILRLRSRNMCSPFEKSCERYWICPRSMKRRSELFRLSQGSIITLAFSVLWNLDALPAGQHSVFLRAKVHPSF